MAAPGLRQATRAVGLGDWAPAAVRGGEYTRHRRMPAVHCRRPLSLLYRAPTPIPGCAGIGPTVAEGDLANWAPG